MGVNALAKYALDSGATVSGSDLKISDFCGELIKKGATVYEGINPQFAESADAVVYSSAIKSDNPELARARAKNIPIYERHEFLGEIAGEYRSVVGVAGTHGKTTTTAMLAHILARANKNFTAMIGGNSVDFANYVNNSLDGKEIFVAEACEYKRNFLSLKPTVAVVTNVECDHPDCYLDYDSVKSAFCEYLSKAPCKIYPKSDSKSDWDISKSDSAGEDIFHCRISGDVCEMSLGDRKLGRISLAGGGDYNFKNATFAVVASIALGVEAEVAIEALRTFNGVARRFEIAGEIDGTKICFDFAHHPTEIACALERAGKYGKVFAIFQPHTYSRTKAYFEDFLGVFGRDKNIGRLMFLPTYGAREKFDPSYEVDSLANAIRKKYGKTVEIALDFEMAENAVARTAKFYGIVIFLGAGDIYDIKNALNYDA